MNKQIAVYDNTVSARTYLSYIAEQAGGFACIGRDGKLYIKIIGQDAAELPLKYFQNFKWEEMFKFSRVRYEDGVQLFEKGDTTGNTIYISQDNMYIVDQEQIDNIYNQLNGLEVYGFEGDSIIDPALDIGDLVLIGDKYVIYQGSSQYGGKFKTSISSNIQGKAKEETTTRTPSQKTINRRVQGQIDQVEGKITTIIEEQEGTKETINSITQTVDSTTSRIEVIENETNSKMNELTETVDGITNQLTKKGGNNIFYYDKEFWDTEDEEAEINLEEYSDTEIMVNSVSGKGYVIGSGTSIQDIEVQNGIYTVSFRYKKIGPELATITVKVNDEEYSLSEIEWTDFVKTIEVNSNHIKIEFTSDTNESLYIADLLATLGSEKQVWTQNPNEIRTDTVTIGKGIKVESTEKNTFTKIDADGTRIYNKDNLEKPVTEFTKDGTETEELIVKGQAQISGLLIKQVGNQTWISSLL